MSQGVQPAHTGLDPRIPASAEPDGPTTTATATATVDQQRPDAPGPDAPPATPKRDDAAEAVKAAYRDAPAATLDDLVERLALEGETHGLKVRQLAPRILHFARTLEPGSITAAEAAIARAYMPALTQTVVLLPLAGERLRGHPIPHAWCWWWHGDRIADQDESSPLTQDTAEVMAPAHEVEYAARRIAQVLRFTGM